MLNQGPDKTAHSDWETGKLNTKITYKDWAELRETNKDYEVSQDKQQWKILTTLNLRQ